jgi:hypothetical protein
MSRTDKDVPRWVTARWWMPIHSCANHYSFGHRRLPRVCNLPAEPVVRWEPWGVSSDCHWSASERYRGGRPPKWFIDHVWNNRARARVRDQLRRARAEYRAAGEVDVVPDVDQHRHRAVWLWD